MIFDKTVAFKQLSVVEAHGLLLARADKGNHSNYIVILWLCEVSIIGQLTKKKVDLLHLQVPSVSNNSCVYCRYSLQYKVVVESNQGLSLLVKEFYLTKTKNSKYCRYSLQYKVVVESNQGLSLLVKEFYLTKTKNSK